MVQRLTEPPERRLTAMPKFSIVNFCWMGYNIPILQEIIWHNTANILFLVPKPQMGYKDDKRRILKIKRAGP